MELKHLQSFIALVEHRSFTRAAAKLDLSQPTVSSHIRMLEEELQSCLIIRTTKSLEITPRGWELYECGTKILALRDDMLQHWFGESKKVIHLGASSVPAAYLLPELMPAYGHKYPDIQIDLHQGDSQGVVEKVLNDSFELGLIGMHCTNEALKCVPFYHDRMVLVTPNNDYYLGLKEQAEPSLRELLKAPLISRGQESASRKTMHRIFKSIGVCEDDLQVTARINDLEAIKSLVAGGVGISIISERATRNNSDHHRLLSFELPKNASGTDLYLIYRKDYVLKPYVADFAQFITSFYLPNVPDPMQGL